MEVSDKTVTEFVLAHKSKTVADFFYFGGRKEASVWLGVASENTSVPTRLKKQAGCLPKFICQIQI